MVCFAEECRDQLDDRDIIPLVWDTVVTIDMFTSGYGSMFERPRELMRQRRMLRLRKSAISCFPSLPSRSLVNLS